MGTQCSCSKPKASSLHQIKHQQQIQTAVPTNCDKPQSQVQEAQRNRSNLNCQTQLKKEEPSSQIKQNDAEHVFEVKHIETKNDKIQNKKQKKRVQVMIPTKQLQESNDAVTFIDKQFSKEVLNFIVKTLKTHFILSQLSPEQAHYVVTKMRYCKANQGDYIFKQGDPSFSYYIILEGKCKVEINKQGKKNLQRGSSFGDLGIIYNAPRSASIFAQSDCFLAELNSKTFKKIINDLNSICQRQNKKIFQNLQFFKQLNDLQKNVLASNCVTEIYQAGQVIFNKGDDANAFYVIQQGIVTILEKKIDLKVGENVGINVIMTSTAAVRSNTLIAKTYCKLLSLTRQIIHKNLGDNVSNILQKNLIQKILKQSDIWEMYTSQQWLQSTQKAIITKHNKGDIIFSKNSSLQALELCILLSCDARSSKNPKTIFYLANSIVQSNKIFKKSQILFDDDYKAMNEGYLAKLILPKQKAAGNQQSQLISSALLNSFINFKKIKELNNPVEAPKQVLSMKDFIVLRRLRSGNFGRVYACYNKITQKKYAIKVMNKQNLISSNVMSYILKQEQLLRTLPEHPFLVKYSTMFRDQNFVMLVMELLEGEDLFDAINEKLPLSEANSRFLISQIILVLEHLHKNKVIYRDLKPENVILKLDGYLKLVDMGTAKKLTMENRFKTMTIIGTPHYMAPEIILGKGYSFSADWWSLGVMLYEMACGKLPYGEFLEDPFSVYQQVLKGELLFTGSCNSILRQVITKLLNKNMQKRLKNGSTQLKQMAFFKDMKWQKLLNKQFDANIFPPKSSSITPQEISKCLEKKCVPALQVFLKDREKES